MVVNGQTEFVGSDMSRAYHEIELAAESATTTVGPVATSNSTIRNWWSFRPSHSPKTVKWRDSNVYLAVTENGLSTFVQRGENGGHRLRHSSVVRSFGIIGRVKPEGANGGQLVSTLRLPQEWKREKLRAVVFVQERDSYRITGASMINLRQ